MRTVALIPARYKSTRFPGKPLVRLLGKPMILWVAELAAEAIGNENVYVATDDERIASVVTEAGFRAVMTSREALTGTDRLAEAANMISADIYLNIQGDEPTVHPSDVLKIRDAKIESRNSVINGYCWIGKHEDPHNVNIPKVITNEAGDLIYMSRLALPGFKEKEKAPHRYKKQVCIYAFDRGELQLFARFGRKSELEACEDIEILRFLELGTPVRMVEMTGSSLAVDVPEDVPTVERALKLRQLRKPKNQ
jgi:3-deoxy-manno-octulosonate cytidylyltransferase (CMP-KDO synthetase)